VLRDDGLELVPLGAPARRIDARREDDPCGPDARGEVVLPAHGVLHGDDGGTRELSLQERRGVAGAVLCLRALEGAVSELGGDGWLRAAPGAGGVAGTARLRRGVLRIMCSAVHAGPRPMASPGGVL
jgi:hypothetical protein